MSGFVQAVAKNGGGSGGGITIANADGLIATTNGSTVLVFLGAAASLANITVSDPLGTVYTVKANDVNGGLSPSMLWVGKPNGSANSITIGGGTVGKVSAIVIEDNSSNGTIDQVAINPEQAATNSPTSGTVNTVIAAETAYGFLFDGAASLSGQTGTITPGGGGWVNLTGPNLANGANDNTTAGATIYGMRRTLSSTGTYQANNSLGSTPTGLTSVIITLMNAGANGGGGNANSTVAMKFYANGTFQAANLIATGVIASSNSPLVNVSTQTFTGVVSYLPSNTTRNTNTLSSEANLLVTLNETGTYLVEGLLSFFQANTSNGGFQYDFAGGSVGLSNIMWTSSGYANGAVVNAASNATTGFSYSNLTSSNASASWVSVMGTIKTSNTGTFGIRWAQATANGANPTTLQQGSTLLLTKIG